MNYTEFKNIIPTAQTKESDFSSYLILSEVIVDSLIVYKKNELNASGIEVYNKAVAHQIEHLNSCNGAVSEGNITSQSVNGTSVSYANSGQDRANISPVSKLIIKNSGLGYR